MLLEVVFRYGKVIKVVSFHGFINGLGFFCQHVYLTVVWGSVLLLFSVYLPIQLSLNISGMSSCMSSHCPSISCAMSDITDHHLSVSSVLIRLTDNTKRRSDSYLCLQQDSIRESGKPQNSRSFLNVRTHISSFTWSFPDYQMNYWRFSQIVIFIFPVL